MSEKSTEAERNESVGVLDRDQALTLIGCVLFAVSIALPVMRWNASEVFSTAGSARVFADDAYTLIDGAYRGTQLIPLSALAVGVVGLAVLSSRLGTWVWWVQATALLVALYYPVWVLHVFLVKLEDPVSPAEGVVVLVLAFAAMVAGTFRSAPKPVRTNGRLDVAAD